MAAKKTAKKKSTRKTAKKSARRPARKSGSRTAGTMATGIAATAGEHPSAAESVPGPADPLRRPVLLFTATTLLIFAAVYYVYGPCTSFARFSRPGSPATDVAAPGAADAEAGDPDQVKADAATIQNLLLAYPKKGIEIEEGLGANLDTVARFLKNNPAAKLKIVGHTCNIGQHPDNDRLSLERAEAVRAALSERGVAPGRLTAIGRGEREPIASNSSDAGRIRNRRVEFRVIQ